MSASNRPTGYVAAANPRRYSFDEICEDARRYPPPPGIRPDRVVELGTCGMGMPVLQSRWGLDDLAPGEVLKTVSEHLCSYPDIHAWVRRSPRVKLLGIAVEGRQIAYYLTNPSGEPDRDRRPGSAPR